MQTQYRFRGSARARTCTRRGGLFGNGHAEAIHNVEHVNALAAGENLSFDGTGITVLYGDNGSGKSRYARVLKRARARSPRGDTILTNIYATASGRPTVVIEFCVNGQNRSCTWLLDEPADALQSAVSVFDSGTANVHVDQTDDVAYTPAPLKILASLAQACQDVKQRLQAEIKALEEQTPYAVTLPLSRSTSLPPPSPTTLRL
jgi:energy-coupling factor transporter ATP-binding protein EcfA2